jgi:serine/threonine protein kinase
MLCGTVPFKASNMKELHKMIMKGKYHLKEEVTDEAKHLLKAMLDINPKTRISVSKILEHPWLKSLPKELPEIFNEEEKAIVKREFIYNNPNIPNRSE